MFDGYCIYDTVNDKYYDYGKYDLELLCNVWNELLEKNEQLKKTIDEMIKIFNDSGLDYCLSDEMVEVLK